MRYNITRRNNMSNLAYIIGKDPDTNEPVIGNLTPNVLILGDSIDNKATLTNSIVREITSNNTPEELQFILVDTKTSSLSKFQSLPHLTQPIVNDPEAFPEILDSLIEEVDRRYDLLIKAKCKSIQKYNLKHPDIIPSIVVVIDELADIMLLNDPAKMEPLFVRFFQRYQRASDVHFIINATTEGDFTKWLTGLMRSNLGMNMILLKPSQEDTYNVFPGLEGKLNFTDEIGYYSNEIVLKKFTI